MFDPSKFLVKARGNREYLEVKWRLVWLRSEHPDAVITTELKRLDEGFALFFAQVTIPDDGGSATGWGSETARDFPDFIEKAETKALGRALAALGYGTQFCLDFEMGNQVADAPVATPTTPVRKPPTPVRKPTAPVRRLTDNE